MCAHVHLIHSTDPEFSLSDKWMWSKSYKHIKNTKLQNIHYTNVIQNSLYTADIFIMSHTSKVENARQNKRSVHLIIFLMLIYAETCDSW